MLFGDYFGNSIVVRPEHAAMATMKEEWHGVLPFIAHGLVSVPFVLAIAGIVSAWYLYLVNPGLPARIAARASGLYTLLDNKYYFDRFNDWFFAGGARKLGTELSEVGDRTIIDGFFVNGTAQGRRLGRGAPSPPAVGIRLSLRVRDDLRAVRAPHLALLGAARLAKNDNDECPTSRSRSGCRSSPASPCSRVGSDRDAARARWIALVGAIVGLRGHAAAVVALRPAHVGHAVRRARRMDPALRHRVVRRRRRHLDALRAAEQPDDAARRLVGVGGDRDARRAVHGRVPDPVGIDQRRVQRARRRSCSTCSSRRC